METKGRKTHWLRTTLIVLIACGLVGCILAGILFMKDSSKRSASSSIEFSFEGAADGKAPNGYAFDLQMLTSDEVLEKALESAGMADRYTPEEIRGQLTVIGNYPENIVSQLTSFGSALDGSASKALSVSDYHPTIYAVTLYSDFDSSISGDDLRKLLGCVMEAYQDYFTDFYSAGTPDIELGYDLERYDYPQQLTLLSRNIESATAYAEEMYQKKPTLMLRRKGFNDIALRLKDLLDTDLSKLNASVTLNHMTKDETRLEIQYSFEIKTLETELAGKKSQLASLTQLINKYDKNEVIYVSAYGALNKIAGNSSETYDQLIQMQKDLSDEITGINAKIAALRLQMKDMVPEAAEPDAESAEGSDAVASGAGDTEAAPAEAADSSAETKAAATVPAMDETRLKAQISRLETRRQAVMKDFAALIDLYNEQQINEGTVAVSAVKYAAPSLLSMAFVKSAVKIAGTICLAGFMVCLVLMIISRKKEEKVK